MLGRLGDAMGNEIHHVQAGDVLPLEEVDRVRVLFTENRDKHVRAGDLLLTRGLDMQDRSLDDPLESQRGLRIDILRTFHLGRVLVHEIGELLAQLIGLGCAGTQNFRC